MQGARGPASVPPLVVAVDGAPGREVGRQCPPHAPVVDDVPDRVHHNPAAVLLGPPARWGLAGRDRQQWGQQRPFGIGGVGRVAARAAATWAGACAHWYGRADWHQGSWCCGLVSSPPSLPGAPPACQPRRADQRSQTARHCLTRFRNSHLDIRGHERSAGTFSNKTDANNAWKKAEGAVSSGKPGDPSRGRQTFETYALEKWLPHHLLEPGVRKNYAGHIRNHLLPAFGPMKMRDIMPE